MMRITIIGAGNMGCALARAILGSEVNALLTIANRSQSRLDSLDKEIAGAAILTTDIGHSVAGADVVIIAVKPYAVADTIAAIATSLPSGAIVMSVAAGVPTDKLLALLPGDDSPIYYAIPNTAIATGHGLTFITGVRNSAESDRIVSEILARSGKVEFVAAEMMSAATALCSCGIAYVYKFIQAGVQAGVQLGFKPDDALDYFTRTVAGAAAMLLATKTSPQTQIDAVTTPGGMTIRGINALDINGMPAAVIKAILAPHGDK